jgi:hypothetical protein
MAMTFDPARDAEQARRMYALAREVVTSTGSPLVRDVGIQILALAKILISETAPADFTHLDLELAPLE